MRTSLWMIAFSMTMTVACTAPAASTDCIDAWESSVEDGEACEASTAALLGETADPEGGELGRGEGDPPAPSGSVVRDVPAPRDAASGLATGRRQHKPLILTME
jgi:hypothetical protein